MAYKLRSLPGVVRLADGAIIPPEPTCPGWLAYLAWVAAGNEPLPADPPPPPIDLSDVDNLERALKALGLVTATWTSHTPAQLKAAFKTAWDSLP